MRGREGFCRCELRSNADEGEPQRGARQKFEQALSIDPNDARSKPAGEATEPIWPIGVFGWLDPNVNYDAKVVGHYADRSIAIDPDDARAYSTKSLYLTNAETAPPRASCSRYREGLAINPNDALLHAAQRGLAENYLGQHSSKAYPRWRWPRG